MPTAQRREAERMPTAQRREAERIAYRTEERGRENANRTEKSGRDNAYRTELRRSNASRVCLLCAACGGARASPRLRRGRRAADRVTGRGHGP